jgi:hypothetical protein
LPSAVGKTAIFVESDLAATGALGIGPLLRPLALEQRITQAGDIEIAAARTFTVFIENGFGIVIGEKAISAA